MSIFSDKIIQRKGIGTEPEPVLTLADADFVIDPVALAATYADGDPVTAADVFTADAGHAPTFVDEDGRQAIRLDGTQYMVGPADIVDGLNGSTVIAIVRTPLLPHLDDDEDRYYPVFHVSTDVSARRTQFRLSLAKGGEMSGAPNNSYFGAHARPQSQSATLGADPIAQVFGGQPLQASDQFFGAVCDAQNGKLRLHTHDREKLEISTNTAGAFSAGSVACRVGMHPEESGVGPQYLVGDIVLLVGFNRPITDEEMMAIRAEAEDRIRGPKLEHDGYFDDLIAEAPDDFAQYRFPRFGDRWVLFQDSGGELPVTKPGRDLIKCVRDHVTSEVVLRYDSGTEPIWMGEHLGAKFDNGRLAGVGTHFQKADYTGDERTIVTRLTPLMGASDQSPHDARGSTTGWLERMDSYTGGQATWVMGMPTVGSITMAVPTEISIVPAHTFSTSNGSALYLDGVQEAVSAGLNTTLAVSGAANIGRDYIDGRPYTGYIQAAAWWRTEKTAAKVVEISGKI